MTLAIKSPVRRETSTTYRRRALIVDLTAYAAVVREKGRRDRVTVPWDAVYDLGLKLLARERMAARKAVAR
jgi:hypothetical protein